VQARAEHEAPSGLRAFGRALSLRHPRACPEIALWLIDDGVDLEAACEALTEGEAPPYWAFCWGSGQLLARFVLDHPAVLEWFLDDLTSASSGAGQLSEDLAGHVDTEVTSHVK
jgi:predicted nicotinamide N-methyase